MSESIKNVVLFGAGGNVGRQVLAALTAAKFNVTILTREDTTSNFPSSSKVVKTDFTQESLAAPLANQDALVSTVTHMSFDMQAKVIGAALAAGVKRVIPSEFGGNTSNDALTEAAPFLGFKRKVVDHLRTLEGKGPNGDFSWSAVITGPFFEWTLTTNFFGFDIASKTATLYDGGTQPFSATKLETVGEAVAATLMHPDITKNRYVFVRSVLTSQRELLENLESATGGEKWRIVSSSAEDLRRSGNDRIASGDFTGNMKLIQAACFTPGLGIDHSADNEKLGMLGDESVTKLVQEVVNSRRDDKS